MKRTIDSRWANAPERDYPRQAIAHACFGCRKSFKVSALDLGRVHACPDCGEPMRMMGRHFKAPRKRDLDGWRKVERLYDAGLRFWDSKTGHAYPKRNSEVDAFLAELREESGDR